MVGKKPPKFPVEIPPGLVERFESLQREHPELGWFSRTHFAVEAFRAKLAQEEDRVLKIQEVRQTAVQESRGRGPVRRIQDAGVRQSSHPELDQKLREES